MWWALCWVEWLCLFSVIKFGLGRALSLRRDGEDVRAPWCCHYAPFTQHSSRGAQSLQMADGDTPISYVVNVIRELPHVNAPFTQGLAFTHDGKYLVETTGAFPPPTPSYIRRLNPETGEVVGPQVEDEFVGVFLEGILEFPEWNGDGTSASLGGNTSSNGSWLVLSFDTNSAYVLDGDFKVTSRLSYDFNGWGLSVDVDSSSFLATNGSSNLLVLDKATLKLKETRPISCLGHLVVGMNELELVPDFFGSGQAVLMGNIINTRLVLAIDPGTGRCRGVFHLQDVSEAVSEDEIMGYHVANGIAYDRQARSWYVTGKNWQKMFEVNLTAKEEMSTTREHLHDTSSTSASMDALELLKEHLASARLVSTGD